LSGQSSPASQSRSTSPPWRRASMARTAGLLRKESRESGWPPRSTSNGPNSRTLKGDAASSDLTNGPLLLLHLAFEDSFGFCGRFSLSVMSFLGRFFPSAVTISGRLGAYNREKSHAWRQARG